MDYKERQTKNMDVSGSMIT